MRTGTRQPPHIEIIEATAPGEWLVIISDDTIVIRDQGSDELNRLLLAAALGGGPQPVMISS